MPAKQAIQRFLAGLRVESCFDIIKMINVIGLLYAGPPEQELASKGEFSPVSTGNCRGAV